MRERETSEKLSSAADPVLWRRPLLWLLRRVKVNLPGSSPTWRLRSCGFHPYEMVVVRGDVTLFQQLPHLLHKLKNKRPFSQIVDFIHQMLKRAFGSRLNHLQKIVLLDPIQRP